MKNAITAVDGCVETAVIQQVGSEELEPILSSWNVQEMPHLYLILCVSHNINNILLVIIKYK